MSSEQVVGMTNNDIIELVQLLIPQGKFDGVVRKDQLKINGPGHFAIVNLENTGKGNGTHWVACGFAEKKPWYFDSFGLGVPEEINKVLGAESEIAHCLLQIQSDSSSLCGLFAVGSCCVGASATESSVSSKLNQFVHMFSNEPNLLKNDEKIKKFIRQRM